MPTIRGATFGRVCTGAPGDTSRSIWIETLALDCGGNRRILFEAAEGEGVGDVLGEMLESLEAARLDR